MSTSNPGTSCDRTRTTPRVLELLGHLEVLLTDLRQATGPADPRDVPPDPTSAAYFDRCRRAAVHEARHDEPDTFAVWALAFLRGIPDQRHRHAALDAVLAALDERDADVR